MAVSKRTGRKSVAANDHLIPLPPGPPIVTDVGTNRAFDNGSAVCNFDVLDNAAVSFKAYATADGQDTITATGTSSPIIVSGLKSNVLYTFTVTSFNSQEVESEPSDPSLETLITTVPATPLAPTATSPNANQDVVSWIAPNSGGKTITGYIWFCSDGKGNAVGGNPGGGPTDNTSVTVNQEAGTAQTYTVYAINANGDSLVSPASASITTTFSFAPFGAFGFSPFGAFGFSPFGAFGFSPFGAFGFSPFGAFGFVPFRAFGFSPFRAFGFSPFRAFGFTPSRCIAANTNIATLDQNGSVAWVKAKDLQPGTTVFSPFWDEFKNSTEQNPYEERVEYSSLTNMSLKLGKVAASIEKDVKETVIFNDNDEQEYSLTQPILAQKNNGLDAWEFTKDLEVGDYFWEYCFDLEDFKKIKIEKIDILKKDEKVYQISVDGIDTFIAGKIVCHNK
jgi:hypothetical protein